MRGYFGIGVERVSKPMNVGNLFRTAHAFGASFVFAIDADFRVRQALSDTSRSTFQVPLYQFESVETMVLPEDCTLVGIELLDEAVALPSFRHPRRAAYVLGPERGGLSAALQAQCAHIAKIPTSFSLNVATAGAIVLYDRMITTGRFGERPVAVGGKVEPVSAHVHGLPKARRVR
ncbi:MAG: RNA methyltransferase [Alphaproteobacteria bacterium]|nr:RNA methyltransferase [Alphaproteobacteria bacterium]